MSASAAFTVNTVDGLRGFFLFPERLSPMPLIFDPKSYWLIRKISVRGDRQTHTHGFFD